MPEYQDGTKSSAILVPSRAVESLNAPSRSAQASSHQANRLTELGTIASNQRELAVDKLGSKSQFITALHHIHPGLSSDGDLRHCPGHAAANVGSFHPLFTPPGINGRLGQLLHLKEDPW